MSLINEALRKAQKERASAKNDPATSGGPRPLPTGGHRPSPVTAGHGPIKLIAGLVIFGCALGAAIAFTIVLIQPAPKDTASQPAGQEYPVRLVEKSVTGAEPPEMTEPLSSTATPEAKPKAKAADLTTPQMEPPPELDLPLPSAPPTPPAPILEDPEPAVPEQPATVAENKPTPAAPPPDKPAQPAEPLPPIAIRLPAEGRITVTTGDQEFSASDVETTANTLTTLLASRRNAPVTIAADSTTPHKNVVALMDALQKAGFSAISLRTVEVPAPKPKAPAADPVKTFLDDANITGVRVAGSRSKVLMNNQVFRIGDVVDEKLGLKVADITSEAIVFNDESGTEFRKSF